jgi:hypothetical protein
MTRAEEGRTLFGTGMNLGQLARALERRRKLIFASMLAFLAVGLIYLHLVDYTYTATLVVSPVPTSSSSAASGLASKLGSIGNLASLAGINLGGDMGNQAFTMYQEGIYSRDVADTLARDPEIMHAVFDKQWDAAARKWTPPLPLLRAIVEVVDGIFGVPVQPWQPPNGALLQEYIADNVDLDTDPQNPIVTITYRYKDPQKAVRFLHELDRAVDNKLRNLALARARQYVGYLSGQLTRVTNTDVRDALMSTLVDQENTVMMASVTAPYAAQPFGAPSASRKPENPKPLLVVSAALVTGGLLGCLGALWLPPLGWPAARFKRRRAKARQGTA